MIKLLYTAGYLSRRIDNSVKCLFSSIFSVINPPEMQMNGANNNRHWLVFKDNFCQRANIEKLIDLRLHARKLRKKNSRFFSN